MFADDPEALYGLKKKKTDKLEAKVCTKCL